MKTVIVSPQIPIAYASGGIGTFTWNFARLLKSRNQDVEVIFTRRPQVPRSRWAPPFEQLGVRVQCVEDALPLRIPKGYSREHYVSEIVAELIPEDTDIVYFADWEANGLHTVRARRFRHNKAPVVVTVLHGNSEWTRQGMRRWPTRYEDIVLDYCERYVVEHSDFVLAPSQFIIDWTHEKNWRLPPPANVRVLGLPFFLEQPALQARTPTSHEGTLPRSFTRIVFYGRLDACKGIDLFVAALLRLADAPCMRTITEVVLLGGPGSKKHEQPEEVKRALSAGLPGITITAYSDFSSSEAQRYLSEHVDDALVVVPSRLESFGLTVVEASLIPGLNLICSNAGGIPEVFGDSGKDQLFAPHLKSLRKKLEQWLTEGIREENALGHYDWQAANQRWADFHEEVCEVARAQQQADTVQPTAGETSPGTQQALSDIRVDVCVPYYNLGKYLPQLLSSLESQTTQQFNVFVLNDGSDEPESIGVFEEMTQRYQQRSNWTFVTTENQGVSRARNQLAALGSADFICFVDADNIATPHMIERFITCITESNDDCLTCYLYEFVGERQAKTVAGIEREAILLDIPQGNFPVAGIIRNPYGDVNCIMRRSVFEALGGFTTDAPDYINHEDRELLTRLSLAGFALDVIPEFLVHYRFRSDSRLQTTEEYTSNLRVVRHYESVLKPLGLEKIISLMLGYELRLHELEEETREFGKTAQAAITWHQQQSQNWERTAAERQAWIVELEQAAAWHQQQSQNWERTAAERQAWAVDLEAAVARQQQQSQSWEQLSRVWEQVAAEREALLRELQAPDSILTRTNRETRTQ